MEFNKRTVGYGSENIACEYLEGQGLKIIARNEYIGRIGELDIIALAQSGYDAEYIFVEVRSKLGKYIDPSEILSARKQLNLKRLARIWLLRNKLPEFETNWRLDLVVVEREQNKVFWYKHIL